MGRCCAREWRRNRGTSQTQHKPGQESPVSTVSAYHVATLATSWPLVCKMLPFLFLPPSSNFPLCFISHFTRNESEWLSSLRFRQLCLGSHGTKKRPFEWPDWCAWSFIYTCLGYMSWSMPGTCSQFSSIVNFVWRLVGSRVHTHELPSHICGGC